MQWRFPIDQPHEGRSFRAGGANRQGTRVHGDQFVRCPMSPGPCCNRLTISCRGRRDAIGADGRTALMTAAAYGHAKVVRALINAGANVNLLDGEGKDAAAVAEEAGNAEIVAMIRKAQVPLHEQRCRRWPPSPPPRPDAGLAFGAAGTVGR